MEPKKKILIIEDDIQINGLYKKILEDAGFAVTVAFDGEEGFKAASLLPDLILLDIMLPKIDGMEVLKRLKIQPSTNKIPVVLLTNLVQSNVVEDAYKIGAQGYIIKLRIDPDELVDYVKKYLQNPDYQMVVGSQGLG